MAKVEGSALHWGDILVIVGYFVAVLLVGILVSTIYHICIISIYG